MKLRIPQPVLADATRWAAKQLPQRPAMPVLGGLKLIASADRLTVEGFDYDITTSGSYPADITQPGAALVSGRLLADTVAALPKGDLDLVADDTHLTVNSDSGAFTLALMPLADYPTLPATEAPSGSVDAAAFASAVKLVAAAHDPDATGDFVVMTGVRVATRGDRLWLYATDRYRIARHELPWTPEPGTTDIDAVIPARPLEAIVGSLTPGAAVRLHLPPEGAGVGAVSDGSRTAAMRLIDPKELPAARLDRIMGFSSTAEARFDSGDLAKAVKRAALVIDSKQSVRLRFGRDQILVSSGDSSSAASEFRLGGHLDGADDFTLAVNPEYLLDGLAGFDGAVRLSLTKPELPALMQPDGEPTGFTYLCVPIRAPRS